MATLNSLWRAGVVAFCFALVGVGGLAYVVTIFPLLRLGPGGRAGHTRRVRAVIRWSFLGVVGILRSGGVMRVEQRNANLLAASRGKPVLVLANHPCYLDILVLIALIPDALCVVKSYVWWNPFYGGVVRAAGYLSNDDPEKLIDACAAALRAGSPLIIFPEGTRSADGRLAAFKAGSFLLAIEAALPIVPISVDGTRVVMHKGELTTKPGAVRLTVHAPFETGGLAVSAARDLAEQVRGVVAGDVSGN